MAGQQPQASPDAIKLQQFGGMLPAWDDHLIPENQAASSQNGYLFSGALAGWRTPKLLYTLKNGASQFAFRLPTGQQTLASAVVSGISGLFDGDQLTLGEEIYTFRDTITQAYDVRTGASVAEAMTNLFQAFTADNSQNTNAGVNYGTGTVPNPAIDQTLPLTKNIFGFGPPRVQVYAPSSGAAFNSTLVGETTGGLRLQWTFNGTPTLSLQGGTNLTFNATITSPSTWLEFADPDTDVMRSPVLDDSFDRYYFASPTVAPTYNTRARIDAGQPAWLLGVPSPGCTPGVEITGGGSNITIGAATSTSVNKGDPGANILYLVPVTPSGATILNDITIMPAGSSATANLQGVLYSDLNGNPHELMNLGVVVTGVTAGTPVSSAFVNTTGLLVNVQYWIGYATDTAFDVQFADDTHADGVVSLNTFSNGPPSIINNLSTGFPRLQVWGNATSSAVQEARSYVYTYISAYGEESAPSPATVLTGWSNGTWTVFLFTPPPDQLGITRNLVKTRIYRSITALSGPTTYYFVADVPITQLTYVDVLGDDLVVGNFQLVSQLYTPPPEDLQGLISMPNGMAVGFRKNEIWFCEPFLPHAWPPSYTLTTEYPIIGLGVAGNSVVACTSGAPYIATGTAPINMSATKPEHSVPCTSRGSIIGNSTGVFYAGTDGLILVTPYGEVNNTSELWITREKWQQFTSQKNLRAVPLVSSYFALGCTRAGDNSEAQRGFSIEMNPADATSFGIWPQPGGHRLGFQKLTAPNAVDVVNMRLDPWSSVCLVLQAGAVYYYDFSDPAPVMQTYKWRSKLFQQKSKKNFAAMRIWFAIPPGTPPQNAKRNMAAFNDPSWASLQPGQYGIVRVYAGEQLVTVREIWKNQELLRIASGFKHETWQFEFEARVPISTVQIGSSVKAMANI